MACGCTCLRLWGGFRVFSQRCADRCFGNTMEEEGSRKTPLLAARVVHVPPFHSGSDGYGILLSIIVILALFPFFYWSIHVYCWYFMVVYFVRAYFVVVYCSDISGIFLVSSVGKWNMVRSRAFNFPYDMWFVSVENLRCSLRLMLFSLWYVIFLLLWISLCGMFAFPTWYVHWSYRHNW